MNETTSLTILPPTHTADLPALMQLAAQLVPTGFLPAHITTPGQAVAIILAGRELGIGPMLALRSVYMIKGKIELSADLQLSLFKRDGGQSEFTELTESKAQLKLKHPNGDAHIETFTIEDARRAGLNGDNWKKFPKAMLRSRVITAGLKSLGFEPKMSGCYAPGEIGGPELAEMVEIEAETIPAPKAATPKPNGNGDKPLKERIAALSLWLHGQLGVDDAAWVVPYLRSHTADGSEKNSALMPNEDLNALSETSLNNIRADTKGFIERIRAFAKANDQIPGAEMPNKITGVIEEVTEKEGSTKGKAWKVYTIKLGGKLYTTFSTTLGEAAKGITGQTVELFYEINDKGITATAFRHYETTIKAGESK